MGPTTTAISPPIIPFIAKAPAARTRFWVLTLLAGWLAQATLRVVLGIQHAVPILIPDESGYLLAARLISGGASSDLSGRTFYQGGYALLIAPVYWLTDDPETAYHLVLGINSMISAGLLVLAYLAFRRMSLPRGRAYVLAHVTALLPSAVYYSQFALTDAVLPVIILGWLLLVHTWLSGRGTVYAVAASALIAFTHSMHARGMILLLVHGSLLVVVAIWQRRTAGRGAWLPALVTAAVAAFGWALNNWLRQQIYPSGVAPHGEWLKERLTSLDGIGWTVSVATGQLWHTIVATWGLAGLGLVALVAVTVRRSAAPPERLVAGTALAAIAGIALATSAALPEEGTIANLAYGRYLSCLSPFLFIAGLVLLTRSRRTVAIRATLATAALTVAAMAVIKLYAGERLANDFFGMFDFPEICFLLWNWDAFDLGKATLAAMLLLAVATLVVVTVRRRTALIIVATACVVAELAIAGMTVSKISAPWGRIMKFATDLTPAGLRPDDRVGVAYKGLHWRIWVEQALAVQTPLIPIDARDRRSLPAEVSLVVVPWKAGSDIKRTWPGAPPGWRPIVMNQNHTGHWVAWRQGKR